MNYDYLKFYNPEGSPLRNLQMEFVETLVHFDSFCRCHDIDYSIGYGTLLGAVRHKGAIPWDDDMDLIITRSNYQKLMSLCDESNNLTNELQIQQHTFSAEIHYKNLHFIDLCIYDVAPTSNILKAIKKYTALLYVLLMKAKWRFICKCYKPFKWWMLFILLAWPFNISYLKKRHQQVSQWFNKSNSNYVACYGDTPSSLGKVFNKNIFDSYVEYDYEGKKVMGIEKYDDYLTIQYGDYMSIPSDKDKHIRTSRWKQE